MAHRITADFLSRQVDYKKLAEVAGFKTDKSAWVCFSSTRKKLVDGDYSLPSILATTPKGKRDTDTADDESDDDPTPTKKPRSRPPKKVATPAPAPSPARTPTPVKKQENDDSDDGKIFI